MITGALVDRVSFDATGRADGVTLRRGDSVLRIAAARAVILCAGTIGSPAILMRSGFGPVGDLVTIGVEVRADLPGVGANLQDHLLAAGNVYRARRPVPPSRTQHSESLTYIPAAGADPAAAPDLVVGAVTLPVVSETLAAIAPPPAPGEAYTLMFGVTHPRSRGRLRLTSADPAAAPEIDPAYLSHPRDRARFLEALDWARRLGHARAYDAWRQGEVWPRPADLGTEAARTAFVARAAVTHHHPIGTCRMGQDRAAVVDPDLRVRGAERLWVVDGAVLPSLTTGPVNAAIVAVAERASDMVARALRESPAG